MIDPRLIHNHEWWRAQRHGEERGRAARGEEWFAPAVRDLAAWLDKTIGAIPVETPPWDVAETLELTLRNEQTFLATLPTALDGELAKADLSPVAAWAWGSALARTALNRPQTTVRAWHAVNNREFAATAFREIMREDIFASEGRHAVIDAFEAMVSELAEAPEQGVYSRERKPFTEIHQRWLSNTRLENVWFNEFRWVLWRSHTLDLLQILRPLDAGQFLDLAERTRLPPAVEQLFAVTEVADDLDELLRLLAAAPSTLGADDTGCPAWAGTITAPMLLSAIFEHAVRLGDELFRSPDDEECRGQQDAEARRIFAATSSVLAGREDGLFLERHWLAYLIGEQTRRETRSDRWAPFSAGIQALVDTLARIGGALPDATATFGALLETPPDLEAMRIHGTGEPQLGRANITATNAFLACALTIEGTEDGPGEMAGPLLELFHTLLIRRDQGLYTFPDSHFPTWRHCIPARLYLSLDHPAQAWQAAWRLTAEQRRRARHGADDHSSDDASFFLACAGLWLVDVLLDEEPARPGAALDAWEAARAPAWTLT